MGTHAAFRFKFKISNFRSILNISVFFVFKSMYDYFLNKKIDREQAFAVSKLLENWELTNKVLAIC